MARSKYELDEAKIQRWIKEGRGQGRGKDYIPWLKVQDVPSKGVSTRIDERTGWTVGRKHHLLSQNELHFFLLLDWSPFVVDVREQFPLLERDYARDIARSLNIPYPRDKKTEVGAVLTCDFIITVLLENGETRDIARTVKPSSELTLGVMQKFQIEQIYLREELDIVDWAIVTDKDIPRAFSENIRLVYFNRHRDSIQLSDEKFEEVSIELTKRVLNTHRPLRLIASDCDQDLKVEAATSLSIAYHLIANRRWKIDMYQPISLSKPLQLLNPRDFLFFP